VFFRSRHRSPIFSLQLIVLPFFIMIPCLPFISVFVHEAFLPLEIDLLPTARMPSSVPIQYCPPFLLVRELCLPFCCIARVPTPLKIRRTALLLSQYCSFLTLDTLRGSKPDLPRRLSQSLALFNPFFIASLFRTVQVGQKTGYIY